MSTIYVDNLQPNLGSGVLIPGHVIQYKSAQNNTSTTLTPGSGNFTVLSLTFTPKSSNSIIRVNWSHGQTTKVSGAGTASWLTCGILLDGAAQGNLAIGALGYPETNTDQRYMPSKTGYISSWSGQKTISHYVNVGSSGSNWTINHQGHHTHLEVMEIAQ